MPRADQPTVTGERFEPADGSPSMALDDQGNLWLDVAVDGDGRVLAGHTHDGRFHVYVPVERLYDAMHWKWLDAISTSSH